MQIEGDLFSRAVKCSCLLWVDGFLGGQEIRKSLKTRNYEKALDKVRNLRKQGTEPAATDEPMTIQQACEEFLTEARNNNLRPSTIYKYGILFKQLREFAERNGYRFLAELAATRPLRQFRSEWKNNALSASKKLQALRAFLNFAEDEDWIISNPARKLKSPRIDTPEAVPFTYEQMASVLRACDTLASAAKGTARLNAIRLRGLVLLLRYSGLRIGDAIGLNTGRLDSSRVFVTTAKSRTPVYIPLPDFVVRALESLPLASKNYFFWRAEGKLETAVKVWETRMKKLFVLAGIPNGHSHQFRHTFATNLLKNGIPIERVSALLGHRTVQVTERHYRHWVAERQQQAEADVSRVWQHDPLVLLQSDQPGAGTNQVQEKKSVN